MALSHWVKNYYSTQKMKKQRKKEQKAAAIGNSGWPGGANNMHGESAETA
jgi:hypothetical protein